VTDPIPTDKVVRVALRRLGEALRRHLKLPTPLPESMSAALPKLDRESRQQGALEYARHYSSAVAMAETGLAPLCPVCGGPMRVVGTITRASGERASAIQCGPCGLSTTTAGAPRDTDV
jgi:hypothetical protein